MVTLYDTLQAVRALDTDDVAFVAVDNTSEAISRKQADQMLTGRDSEGGQLGAYQNEEYALMKNRMNPVPGFGVVDLRLTGSFQQRIVTNVVGDMVITESTDEKAEALKAKYGPDIYGLNATFAEAYLDEDLRPEFGKEIENRTGLKCE